MCTRESRKPLDAGESAPVASSKTSLKCLVNASYELIMDELALHMALAQDNARPERREIKNATLERSVGNFCGCISIYKASCKRKLPHSAESPA